MTLCSLAYTDDEPTEEWMEKNGYTDIRTVHEAPQAEINIAYHEGLKAVTVIMPGTQNFTNVMTDLRGGEVPVGYLDCGSGPLDLSIIPAGRA